MKKIAFWFNNSRPVSLPQSVIPALTAVFLSAWKTDFSIILGILGIIGVASAHLSMNLIDDYFDYRKMESGYRDALVREGVRARTQKCPYLVSGEATMKQLKKAIIAFAIPAFLSAGIIFAYRGLPIIIVGIITLFLGISYSGNPLKFSYRGLGELIIGIIFGPLIVIGISYASAGSLDWIEIMTGIAMGFMVTNILFTHSILDYEADLRAGKSTLAGLLKKKSLKLIFSGIFTIFPYLIFILGFIFNLYNFLYLSVLLTLPWAISLVLSIRHFLYSEKDRYERKLWYGPMKYWKNICEMNLDWFMLRWYLARNIVTGFGLIVILVTVIINIIK